MNEYHMKFIGCTSDTHKSYYSWTYREKYVMKYAWAVPNEEALNLITKYSPIIEIGAGTGYWASLLNKKGCDIVCFDVCPPHPLNLYGTNDYKHWKQWFEVKKGYPDEVLCYPNRNLFLCWAPYDDPMAKDCLKCFINENVKAKYLIWIGEGEGGYNGGKGFFKLLREHFKEVTWISIPQWYGIHDFLVIYERI